MSLAKKSTWRPCLIQKPLKFKEFSLQAGYLLGTRANCVKWLPNPTGQQWTTALLTSFFRFSFPNFYCKTCIKGMLSFLMFVHFHKLNGLQFDSRPAFRIDAFWQLVCKKPSHRDTGPCPKIHRNRMKWLLVALNYNRCRIVPIK